MSVLTTTHWADEVDSRTNCYVRSWMRHFPQLRASYAENWWPDLRDASLPAELLPLSSDERDLLIDDHWRRVGGRPAPAPAVLEPIILRLEERILRAQRFSPTGAAFVRLGSRAPTDSLNGLDSEFQVDGGPEALELLLDSERVFDDLCLAQECAYLPAILVRPWLDVPTGRELRAFLRAGELVGLSQRHTDTALPALVEEASALEAQVKARCAALQGRWPLDELVVDFACLEDEAWIVDLHPWGKWSSAGLFSWDSDTFGTYEFRYVTRK
ncbi:MAG: hypothetical protein JKY65_30705 [Planctomycetes bacterium]|nr:hypothetical protein [Planctomycetota bacterium]